MNHGMIVAIVTLTQNRTTQLNSRCPHCHRQWPQTEGHRSAIGAYLERVKQRLLTIHI